MKLKGAKLSCKSCAAIMVINMPVFNNLVSLHLGSNSVFNIYVCLGKHLDKNLQHCSNNSIG